MPARWFLRLVVLVLASWFAPAYAGVSTQYVGDPGNPPGFNQSGTVTSYSAASFASTSFGGVTEIIIFEGIEFLFSGVGGGPLQVGHYDNAGTMVDSISRPRMGLDFRDSTCDFIDGTLDVFEVEYSPGELPLELSRLVVAMEFRCVVLGVPSPGKFWANLSFNGTVAPPPPPLPPPPPPPPAPPVVTTASGPAPNGGTITLSIASGASSCALPRAFFIDPRLVTPPIVTPPNVAMTYGWIDFSAENCAMGQPVTFTVEYPQPLPPTAQWWKYGPTANNRTPHWYAFPSIVSGNRISFTITDGMLGDDDLMMNGVITDLGGVGVAGGELQDLWWSGPAENGWGMSIIQHREILFANIYVYDAQGKPIWYVMPSGTWNEAHTAFTGALFLPKGSPFYAYDLSRFNVGASVGTMTLTFANVNEATFDYTINGTTGRKNITRALFGPADAPTDKPLADLYWGGPAQNGWGLAVLQQYQTLFALWFTYDASGNPTWFAMPGGSWAGRDDYRGSIYRAEGPPWLGTTYDVTRHRTIDAGSYRLRFSGDAATFDYVVDGRTGSLPLSRIPF